MTFCCRHDVLITHTTTTVLRPSYEKTWHLQLRTGGFCWCKQSFAVRMSLLTATSAFGLGRRCCSAPQQGYLHCLRTLTNNYLNKTKPNIYLEQYMKPEVLQYVADMRGLQLKDHVSLAMQTSTCNSQHQ